MTRLRRAVPVVLVLIAAVAALPATAKTKRHHTLAPRRVETASRIPSFPAYIDRGSDRNPGGDDLYFNDTKAPHYIVGPAWFHRWEEE